MADLFDLQAKITLDSSEYESGINEAGEKTDSFISKLGSGLGNAAKVGAGAIAAVGTAASAAVGSLIKGTGEVAALGDNIDKASQKMGISAQAYQEWDAILQHSGSSIDAMSKGMITLQKNAVDNAEKFEALGLTQEDVASMNTEDLFAATIAGLQKMGEGAERTALAQELLGGATKELGPLLNTSAEDTEEMRKRVHELGGVLSDEAVKSAAAYQDSLQDMQTAFSGIKNNLMSEFLPSITYVMNGLTSIFTGEEGGVEAVTEGINSFVSAISAHIPELLQIGTSILTALIDAISENIPTLLNAGVDMVLTIGDAIIQNLPLLVEAALQVILQLANGLAESLPVLIPTIVDVVIQIVETLIDNVDMLVDSAIAIIMALATGLIDAVPRLIEKAPEIIMKLLDALIENAPKLLEAGLELIVKVGEGIANAISSIWEAGKAIVEGLWEGIKGAASWLWDQITGWIGGVVDGIKGFLGIHSPSTVFADIGENMADGLGVGFGDGMEGVQRDVPDAIRDGFEPMLAESQKMIDNMNLLWEQVGLGAYTAWEQIVFVWTEAIVWFDETVIIPLKEHFTEFYEYVSKLFSDLWEDVKSIWGIAAEWFLYEVINPIIENFEAIPEPISSAFQAAWEGVTSIWGGAAGWFEANVVQPILASIQNIATALDGALKDAENRMSNMSNSVNTGSGNVLNGVPQMATGGILRRGQVALLEGKGSEAVIPLDQNKRWISALSNDLMSNMQKSNKGFGGGNEITINVYSREGQSVTDLAEEVNRRLWQSLNEREAVWA